MPTVTRGTGSATPSLAVTINDPGPHQIHGRAATDLLAGDVVYLASVAGVPTLTRTNGATSAVTADYIGVIIKYTPVGEKATAYHDVEVKYGTGLTFPARVYVSATPGAIDDTVTANGTVAIGRVVNDTNIYFFAPNR